MNTGARGAADARPAGKRVVGKRVRLGVAALAASLIGIATPAIALAGNNGQQLEFSSRLAYSVQVCGTNQYGNSICSPRWSTPNYTTWFANWWWVGATIIHEYDSNGRFFANCGGNVPKVQASDWLHVYCP